MSAPKLYFGKFSQPVRKDLDAPELSSAFSLGYLGETLYISCAGCVLKYSSGKYENVALPPARLFSRSGRLFAAFDSSLYEIKEDGEYFIGEFDSGVRDISFGEDNSFWLITDKTLYLKTQDGFESVVSLPEDTVCLAALKAGEKYTETVYVGSSTAGLMSLKGKRRHWAELLPGVTGVLGSDIRAIAFDGCSHLWVASKNGVNVYDGRSFWLGPNQISELPLGSVNDMLFSSGGRKYFAMNTGVTVISGGKRLYYSYGTWLSHPSVKKIAVSNSGAIAALTAGGVNIIEFKEMTLGEKAAHYDKLAAELFLRKDGYSVSRRLNKYGCLEDGTLPASDNDGLFSGLYCASQCFRYKVTGEKQALKNAVKSIEAMLKLTTVTGKKGFTARAIRYSDEPDFGSGNRDEWHVCEDNPDIEWLGETSSDEMTGHYFAYSVFYDLCANDSQKLKIRQAVGDITDHILENGFCLSDVDGRATTWANWNPLLLNHDDRWYYERGTNSLEMLSFLSTAYHITGCERYKAVFDELVKEHHFAMNAMRYKIEDAHISHIDDQLDFTNIYPLLQYCDAQHAEIFKLGLTHHYRYELTENSPYFNIVYGSLTCEDCNIEAAAAALSQMPLTLVRWPVYNSFRSDLVWDDEQEKIGMPRQLKYPVEQTNRLPLDYDSNQFVCDSGCEEFAKLDERSINRLSILPGTSGANGMSATMPYIFLLPYWMGRYYGLLGD